MNRPSHRDMMSVESRTCLMAVNRSRKREGVMSAYEGGIMDGELDGEMEG